MLTTQTPSGLGTHSSRPRDLVGRICPSAEVCVDIYQSGGACVPYTRSPHLSGGTHTW